MIDLDHDLDAIVERLSLGARHWAGCGLDERRDLLREVCAGVAAHADTWVALAAAAKGLPADSSLVGEEWLSGPYAVISYAQALQETLHRVAEGSDVLAGCSVRPAPGGRLAVDVLPHDLFDRILLSGYRAEVWTLPGTTEEQLRAGAGRQGSDDRPRGEVALVLGAGNIFSIAPLDVLHQLYAEDRAAVLKLNPTTDGLEQVFRAVFEPMIDRNLVEIVTGGPDVGSALAHHAGIGAVHLTGSAATHDAIVWGSQAGSTPVLTKPISSELGGVSPVIVVPGRWSAADLEFQAQHVATQRLHNSGANCVATQVVVVSSDWDQKDDFLATLTRALEAAPRRTDWYPGCDQRVADARDRHPDAVAVGGDPGRTLLPGLDPQDQGESAFATEYFGPVLGVTELPGDGAEFLDVAVAFVNTRLSGTLGANILVHPRTRRALGDRFLGAVADLRYGTVAVNAWTGVGYLTARATWGAFPGHTLDDVQSGIGIVHNALLLADTERTVVTGPFRPFPRSVLHGELSLSPKPPWFVGNRTAATTGRRLTRFAARPRWRALPGIFASALRG